MTAQSKEKLKYKGQNLLMSSTPLSQYFAMGGYNPGLRSFITSNWRGYIGTWEILDNRLYLVELRGTVFADEGEREVSLKDIFPDYPKRVFAHWYTGSLRIPEGELLEYVHMGFQSTYESDLLLEIEKGVLIQVKHRKNYENK